MIAWLRELIGWHKPKSNMKISRGDDKEYRICLFCKREIVRLNGRWRLVW